MKLLISADIHMGRKPSVGSLIDVSGHSAWKKLVSTAIEHRVDALILAGDVVDKNDLWFSVYGHILEGLKQLDSEGIRVFGVAGNHDATLFSQLARELSSLTIIGNGGNWERVDFHGIELVGWSFPQSSVKENPFESFVPKKSSKLSVGILHTDVGSQASSYAPTQLSDYQHSDVDVWMLGHIHKPGQLGDQAVYYCGSPYPLDRSETGSHGAYLLTSESLIEWEEIRHLQIAPYRFEELEVDLSDCADTAAIETQITQAFHTEFDEFEEDVFVRLTVTGRIDQRLLEDNLFGDEERYIEFLTLQKGGILYVDRIYTNATTPPLDIDEIAKGSGPAALLAQQILDPAMIDQWANEYRVLEEDSFHSSIYRSLPPNQSPIEEVRLIVREEALLILQTMMNQIQEEQ
ncbi:MAG: metallophosphoesterase [Sphaerochaeta sp.]